MRSCRGPRCDGGILIRGNAWMIFPELRTSTRVRARATRCASGRFSGAGDVSKHMIINNIILNLGGRPVGIGLRVPYPAKRTVGHVRCQAGRAATMKRLARE